MHKRTLSAILFAVGAICCHGGEHRVGFGARYWISVEDVDIDHIDRTGLAYCATYQYRTDTALQLGIAAELEQLPEDYAASGEHVYTPQAYLVAGRDLYGALGVGAYFSDGEFSDDLFYALRAGVDLELLPKLYLDLHADYRFENFEDLVNGDLEFESDTIFLGAAIRLGI